MYTQIYLNTENSMKSANIYRFCIAVGLKLEVMYCTFSHYYCLPPNSEQNYMASGGLSLFHSTVQVCLPIP